MALFARCLLPQKITRFFHLTVSLLQAAHFDRVDLEHAASSNNKTSITGENRDFPKPYLN